MPGSLVRANWELGNEREGAISRNSRSSSFLLQKLQGGKRAPRPSLLFLSLLRANSANQRESRVNLSSVSVSTKREKSKRVRSRARKAQNRKKKHPFSSKVDHLPLPEKEPAPRLEPAIRARHQRQPHGRVRPFLRGLGAALRAHVGLDGAGAQGKGAQGFSTIFLVFLFGEGEGQGARVADLGELL